MMFAGHSRSAVLGGVCCAAILGWSLVGCEKDPVGPDGDGDSIPAFNTQLYELCLTEIHYNPTDLNATVKSDSLEFIELRNMGSAALKVGGLVIGGGVDYAFPESASVAAGGYYVIASSKAGFTARYGKAPDGVYSGVLKNSGETITCTDTVHDSLLFSQFYTDSLLWPADADGKGYSLVTVDSTPARGATDRASAWRKSARLHGSPGATDVRSPANAALFNLRITEINYNPIGTSTLAGDSLEFIELKNSGSAELAPGGVEFISGISYAFPSDAKIKAGEYIVLASNTASFKKRYPDVPVFGTYAGTLSNSGEKLVLADTVADTAIITIEYKNSSPWPSIADGEGHSIVTISNNPGINQNNPGAWRRSFGVDGSPGASDPGAVVINEVLASTDMDNDAIELYNPGENPVNISGWYLSDNALAPAKFKIPDSTVIPAGGYATFTEKEFNKDTSATSFSLSAHGENLYLCSDARGSAYGYCHTVSFGEVEKGVSVGRLITSTGKEVFVAQKTTSMGAKNEGPKFGPLVISEIMYHSLSDAGDYVEITNISDKSVPLSFSDSSDTTWKLDGAGFSFPADSVIKPGEAVVIAMDSVAPATLRKMYSIADSVRIFMNVGGLKNSSEMLKLLKPEAPYDTGAVDTAGVAAGKAYPYLVVDKVEYSDGGAWPMADGNGVSLHRKTDTYGDDPASWTGASPTPGKAEK
jgi:hypothetical protein